MIVVEVEVPSLERKYQFSLEAQVPVDTLVAEITEIICQKEQCKLHGRVGEMCLCSGEQKRILNRYATLSQQGIKNADCLLLI